MVNSIISIYVQLIRSELERLNIPADRLSKILNYLDFIEERAQLSQELGKTPEQLKPYLISKGEGMGLKGTVVYKGKPIPRTALNIANKRKKN